MSGATGGFVFKPNPYIEAALEGSQAMLGVVEAKAEAGAEAARGIAPVLSGDYRDGIEAEAGFVGGLAVGRINGHDFKSHWVEFGTSSMAAQGVLRRALDSLA